MDSSPPTFAALAVAQQDVSSGAGAAEGAGNVDAGVGAEPGSPFLLVHLALVEVCGDRDPPASHSSLLGKPRSERGLEERAVRRGGNGPMADSREWEQRHRGRLRAVTSGVPQRATLGPV